MARTLLSARALVPMPGMDHRGADRGLDARPTSGPGTNRGPAGLPAFIFSRGSLAMAAEPSAGLGGLPGDRWRNPTDRVWWQWVK
jgi:hypothetical protein